MLEPPWRLWLPVMGPDSGWAPLRSTLIAKFGEPGAALDVLDSTLLDGWTALERGA
jgi:hypothetical protein